jgi:hypothetical protein
MRLHTFKIPKAKNAGGRNLVGQRRPWAAKSCFYDQKRIGWLADEQSKVNLRRAAGRQIQS